MKSPEMKHLLIPLDGSRLAESAIPYGVALAKALGARVTLFHVLEERPPQDIHGEHHLIGEEEACKYLGKLSDIFPPEVEVESHVHTEKVRNVARSIADHIGEFSADLIVMCAHGEGGFRDLMVGGIAQQVISRAKTPVLLIQPQEDQQPDVPAEMNCFLVALDGEPDHEQGLPMAEKLARKLGASLELLTVVPTLGTLRAESAAAGRLLPGTTTAMLDMTESYARDHLQNLADRLKSEDLKTGVNIVRGDPAVQVLAVAQSTGCDLVVLGTHGRSGMGAFWAGSVASKIVSAAHQPLLLVPV
jgi:nucleotide-binding universal stress UspA family protein